MTMYPWPSYDSEAAAAASSEWTTYSREIIRRALRKIDARDYDGSSMFFVSEAVGDLKGSLEKLQRLGYPLWKVERFTKVFSAPSEVVVSEINYVCIYPHNASTINAPGGTQGSIYWVPGGSNGIDWAEDSAYTSSAIFALDTDVMDVFDASTHKNFNKSDVDIVRRKSMFDYSAMQIGVPTTIYLDKQETPVIWVFPIPGYTEVEDNLVLSFDVVKKIAKMEPNTAADFPSLAIDWLVYDLAIKLATNFNKEDKIAALMLMREEVMSTIRGNNAERDDNKLVKSAF